MGVPADGLTPHRDLQLRPPDRGCLQTLRKDTMSTTLLPVEDAVDVFQQSDGYLTHARR
ncbi:hypothetical protein [Streptomyces sp. NPDC059802]|uniref:hypothetical protein n=1 Tax=Streptomyces sp. NPDC059802 TaxID=3346952 RepID=UPI00365C58D3